MEINFLSQRGINELERIVSEQLNDEERKKSLYGLDFLERDINSAYPGLAFERYDDSDSFFRGVICYNGTIELFDEDSKDTNERIIHSALLRMNNNEKLMLTYIIRINPVNKDCVFEVDSDEITIDPIFFNFSQLNLIIERAKKLKRAAYEIHNALRDYATKNDLSYTEHPDIDYENPDQSKFNLKS